MTVASAAVALTDTAAAVTSRENRSTRVFVDVITGNCWFGGADVDSTDGTVGSFLDGKEIFLRPGEILYGISDGSGATVRVLVLGA